MDTRKIYRMIDIKRSRLLPMSTKKYRVRSMSDMRRVCVCVCKGHGAENPNQMQTLNRNTIEAKK